jgi:quinol monooxygenase YgiN
MTTIDSDSGMITQINIFKVEPDKVDLLVETLQAAAQTVKDVPGWVSINLHVALDRTQVANYAQCATKAAWDKVMEILFANGFIERLVAIATPEPCLYDIVWSLDRTTRA